MSTEPLPMLEAVGEAWASIDGKIDLFRAGMVLRAEHPDGLHEDPRADCFDGYMIEAESLLSRVALRGWRLVPIAVVNADEVVK